MNRKNELAGVSILNILFVFYRNKFQFTEFHKSDKNVKIKRGTSTVLLSISLLMLVIVPLLK
ncbi:hypothetical protein NCCP2716_28540 [Sporosarcina sp. NCCP-2716]|nr:hypothetical protein NCCP2716_28540 [Sporosarcina sp. NCCP-2716]